MSTIKFQKTAAINNELTQGDSTCSAYDIRDRNELSKAKEHAEIMRAQSQKWRNKLTLLKIKEVAELLNVSMKTLYQWAELGQIPCIKLNGTWRFDLQDIQAWIQSCKKVPSSEYNPLTKLEARKGGKKN